MKKIAHFVGIAGVGMGATATLLKEKGWVVTGSDKGCFPPMSEYLKEQKITVHDSFEAKNVPEDADVVVVGMSATIEHDKNPEIIKAKEIGIAIKSFPEILGELSAKDENIVVVGSYGKSTTTALIAWCLRHTNIDPSYFIGALPLQMQPAHIGSDKVFVFEGDEYPTSNTDDRSKFLHFSPRDVVLISAEHDHVNKFPTIEDYLKPYRDLLALVPDDGIIMACTDNPNVSDLIKPHGDKSITYGINPKNEPKWLVENIKYGAITTFDLIKNGKKVLSLETTLIGDHNVQNIAGALALLFEKKLINENEAMEAISSFRGIKRRLELKTEKSSVIVYEGFGSSYDKAKSAIRAVKTYFPDRNLIIVFEPHAFSWRNRNKISWYDDIFDVADKVYIYQPPEIGESDESWLTHDEILDRVSDSGVDVTAINSPKDGIDALENEVKKNDIILLLTSGELGGLVSEIPLFVEKKFPLQHEDI